MGSSQGQSEVAEKEVSGPPFWCEVYCQQCERLISKFTAYAIDQEVKEVAKFCVEGWCRHCKLKTFKTVVI